MKSIEKIVLFLPILSLLFGCSSTDINHQESSKPTISQAKDWKEHYKKTRQQRLHKYLTGFEKKVKVIKTPEIIRILETEPVIYVNTSPSQKIDIVLDDGRCFRGVYVPKECPEKYSKALHCNVILNLSEYIRKKRQKTWETWCEDFL